MRLEADETWDLDTLLLIVGNREVDAEDFVDSLRLWVWVLWASFLFINNELFRLAFIRGILYVDVDVCEDCEEIEEVGLDSPIMLLIENLHFLLTLLSSLREKRRFKLSHTNLQFSTIN